MFNSTILDVAVGLVFAFLAVSLVASVVVEAISSAMKWRSGHLLEGIKQLVNDPEFKGLALKLYQHAAVNPRGLPPAAPGAPASSPRWLDRVSFLAARPVPGAEVDLSSSPAYVDGAQFAGALMDILGLSAAGAQDGAAEALKKALDDLAPSKQDGAPPSPQADPQLHQLLTGIVQRCKGDIARIQTEIGDWFDNGMDRLSGAYKRRTQVVSVLVGLAVAVVVNVDAIQIVHVLWDQPTLVEDLKLSPGVAAAVDHMRSTATPPAAVGGPASDDFAAASAVLQTLDAHLPVGWQGGQSRPEPGWGWIFKALGWLITAGATLFGAPFWFDTLQAVIRLKGSGPSPQDTRDGRAAAGGGTSSG